MSMRVPEALHICKSMPFSNNDNKDRACEIHKGSDVYSHVLYARHIVGNSRNIFECTNDFTEKVSKDREVKLGC